MGLVVVPGLAWLVSRGLFLPPDEAERQASACARLSAERESLLESTRTCENDAECVHFRGSCDTRRVGNEFTTLISIEETLFAGCDLTLEIRDCGETTPVCVENLCGAQPVGSIGQL